MSSTPDIGRIIQLIMENPNLVDEISRLAKTDSTEAAKVEIKEEEKAPLPIPQKESSSSSELPKKQKRTELLGALKPYLSGERAKAIDSMLSVVEIIDMMKTR